MILNQYRILLHTPLPPPSGGDSTWTLGYLDYAKQNKIEVDYVNTSVIGSRSLGIEGSKSIFEEIIRAFRIWINLITKIIYFKPEIVHFNSNCSPKGLIRDLISSLILKIFKIKFIIHCHCNVRDQLGDSKLPNWLFKAFSKNSNFIIVLNHDSLDYLTDILRSGEIIFIPNFIKSEFIRKESKKISKVISKIVFVGHIRKSKGIIEIISVAEKLPKKTFNLIGPIHHELKDYHFPNNVLLSGPSGYDEIISSLDDADLFLFPSHTEGFSIAMLEAMSRGLPIIASNVGANEYMAGKGGAKIIFKGNIDSILDCINQLEDYFSRKYMSEYNMERVSKYFNSEKIILRYLELYRRILSSNV